MALATVTPDWIAVAASAPCAAVANSETLWLTMSPLPASEPLTAALPLVSALVALATVTPGWIAVAASAPCAAVANSETLWLTMSPPFTRLPDVAA